MHGAVFDPVITERLIGERPRPDHGDGLLGVLGEGHVGEALWPGPLGGPRSAAQVQELLLRDAEHWEREGFGPWVLSERDGEHAVVARGGLERTTVCGRDEVEIAYAVAASHWGQGLATEIARAARRVAFEELHLPEVIAYTRTTNLASQRVMAKTGLHRESVFQHVELPHVLFRARGGAW